MSNYRRRVEVLEQATRILNAEQAIERDLREMWPEVERIAAEADISPEELAEEVRQTYRRRAEIGEEAWFREYAAEIGITVDELRDPDFLARRTEELKQEWAERREKDRAWEAEMRAKQMYWRAGVKYVGGVPVPDGRPPGAAWTNREGA